MERIREKECLEEMKLLNMKGELAPKEAERWNELCDSISEYDFRNDLLETLDCDQELTSVIHQLTDTTGSNIEQIIFGGVALGKYIIEKLFPNRVDPEFFWDFWIDTCQYNADAIAAIDHSIDRAIDGFITRADKERN